MGKLLGGIPSRQRLIHWKQNKKKKFGKKNWKNNNFVTPLAAMHAITHFSFVFASITMGKQTDGKNGETERQTDRRDKKTEGTKRQKDRKTEGTKRQKRHNDRRNEKTERQKYKTELLIKVLCLHGYQWKTSRQKDRQTERQTERQKREKQDRFAHNSIMSAWMTM